MIPLPIRNRLFACGFRIHGHALMEVPLIAATDLAVFLKFGWRRSLRFMHRFRAYRENLGRASWSCLTSIYPRANYLTYYYFLFWWAEYCGAEADLFKKPERSLIAELYFRYIVEIDRLIDMPSGMDFIKSPHRFKTNPAVEKWLNLAFREIADANLSALAKRSLFHQMWAYRRNCVQAFRELLARPNMDLERVLDLKERTAGGLFRTWAGLLATVYGENLPRDLVRGAQEVLAEVSMAMQLFEDMLDFPEDYATGTLNIFHELLKEDKNELHAAESYLAQSKWNHLDFIWAQRYLPRSYAAIFRLSDAYLQRATRIQTKPELITDLCSLVGDLPTHTVV
jgi:hypothetical protein